MHGELHKTQAIQSSEVSGIFWMRGELPPIPEGFRNFHEALLVFQDNPLPVHLSINTGHIIPLSMQLSTDTGHIIFQKVRGDMRGLAKSNMFDLLVGWSWILP